MATAEFKSYIENGIDAVEGWVVPSVLPPLRILADEAAKQGISGGACEIGVHHGRLFIALLNLVGSAHASLGIDVFDLQHLNIDTSGKGSREAFLTNLETHSPFARSVMAMEADSMDLTVNDIAGIQNQFGKFRLFSIDGGHTRDHASNDLAIAQELLANGGVLLLDDFFQQNWPGVTEGFYHFMANQNKRLAPVCIAGSKLFLTTISYQKPYALALDAALASAHPDSRRKWTQVCSWDTVSFML